MKFTHFLTVITKKLGIYNLIRYSNFYYWSLQFRRTEYSNNLMGDLKFCHDNIGNSLSLVFDIGSNKGDKAWAFQQIAQKVVCVEPDIHSFALLRRRFGHSSRIALENVAIGAVEGEAEFYVEADGSFLNTLSEKHRKWLTNQQSKQDWKSYEVEVSTLDYLIKKYGVPDYLKIDVEGYELEALSGLNQPIPLLSFEANLPMFRQETLEIIGNLVSSGVHRFNLRHRNSFVFPQFVDASQVLKTLDSEQEITYEIFASNAD